MKIGPAGITYIANIGDIIYNDRVVRITNKIIPIFDQVFFTLPADKDKYAAVNAYYNVDSGVFEFDLLGIYANKVDFIKAEALWNKLPIAQFTLKQDLGSFIVENVNEFTEMATYAVTSDFIQGVTGLPGAQGLQGITGYQGFMGLTGYEGVQGLTGIQGITGVGPAGEQGLLGVTGLGYDYTYLADLKFESNRVGVFDRSLHEVDCVFSYTGMAGTTGFIGVENSIVGMGGSVTGLIDSSFTRVPGIVDYAHDVYYGGGISEYSKNTYLPFSGAISCWLKLNQRPRAMFTYTIGLDYKVTFLDSSLSFPTEWLWDFGDGLTTDVKDPVHIYSEAGSYIVSLKVTNELGSSFRYAEITIV